MALRLDKTWNEINAAYEAGKIVKIPGIEMSTFFNYPYPVDVSILVIDENDPEGPGVPVYGIIYNDELRFAALNPTDYPIDMASFMDSLNNEGSGDGGVQ